MVDRRPDLRALVLNYCGAEMTMQVVRDLIAMDDVVLSIVVIDNGSGGAEQAALEQALDALRPSRHTVDLLRSERNLGYAGAMSLGLRRAAEAGFEYLLVCNNDLRMPAGSVAPLLAVLRNDPRIGAVGPTILGSDGTVWAEGGELGFTANALRLRRHGRAPTDRSAGPEEVDFLTGACLLLRVEPARAAGGFPEDYFMYWEDVALSHALRRAGHGVVWVPWVRVEHRSGQSSGGGRSPMRKYFMACNAVRFLRAHGTARSWLGWLVFDVLFWPLTIFGGPGAAFAKLRGTLDGLRGHAASAADVARYLG